MRRAWLRGRDNLQKRYLIHVCGYNLVLIIRLLTGYGTPRQWADVQIGVIWPRDPIDDQHTVLFCCLVVIDRQNRGAILGKETALLTR